MELITISKGLLQVHSLTQFHYSLNQHHKFLTPILKNPWRSRPLLLFNPSFCSRVSNKSTDFDYDYDYDEEQLVDVIGIGNRTDAVFDFCSNSPFVSPALSFSTLKNSQSYAGNVVIVVVVVANGVSEHQMRVMDEIVDRVKSTNGLAVGIIVKPFSFERRSRRGQGEVKGLLEKLREQTDFCIGIDTDVLLEKDCFVTLDEALKTANTAVLMAINAVSFLVSKSKKKKTLVTFSLQDNDNMKELLQVSEIKEILKGYKQAEVGFGDGNSVKTSTTRAIYDSPFLSAAGLKDLDGIVIGFIASSEGIEKRDIRVFLTTLRKNSDFKGQIILGLVHDPILEPNHIITTVITVRSRNGHQESSIFSQLSQRFPFIFNLLKRQPSETHNRDTNPTSLGAIDTLEMPDLISANSDIEEGFGNYSAEFQTLLANNDDEVYNLSVPEANENGFPEPAPSYSSFYDGNNKGVTSYEREPLIRIFESVYQEECGNDSGDTSLLGILSIVKLPVGVKPSAELKDSLYNSDNSDQQKEVVDENIKSQQINITPPRVSSKTSTDAGFEAVSELFDTGSVLKGTTENISKREGVVSARAASMLESERRSEKKWNPIIEMKYRRGLYKGRCQGGLPEGKGRLSLSDGSIYDGMWRSGKRSGFGTFKFSNGDFYQGSWRDDVMHGKGWLYFETGDRWFVNFWKGKANGEGRFYSKFGETFFGHFKDGWRHGDFLCISVDGERYFENWDEGVRVSRRKQLDADSGREQCSKDSEHNN